MIKIHPAVSKCRLDDKRMNGLYDFASRLKLCVLVHTWLDNDPYGNMDIFSGVAKDHPDISWIMGHSGGPYGSRHAVDLAQETANIYLDLTISMCPARQVEFFVKEVGSERVLFGTDNPFLDPRPQVGRVALADISEEDKVNIFGANARRLISLE
jgi:predicted TIM-barrel fold metal-dependent hydrolase